MSTSIATGRMDRQVTLQVRTVNKDLATNADVHTWADGDTVWAYVRESTGDPAAGQADAALDSYGRPSEVWIHWRDGFDMQATRLKLDGQVLRITGVAQVGLRDKLKLAVREWAHE